MRASGHIWETGKPSKEASEAASPGSPSLSGSQRALLQVDLDTELPAEPKEKVPHPNQILK